MPSSVVTGAGRLFAGLVSSPSARDTELRRNKSSVVSSSAAAIALRVVVVDAVAGGVVVVDVVVVAGVVSAKLFTCGEWWLAEVKLFAWFVNVCCSYWFMFARVYSVCIGLDLLLLDSTELLYLIRLLP